MRKKWLIFIVLAIIIAGIFYANMSTKNIDEGFYRNLGWEITKHDKTIINWESAEVKLVDLNETYKQQMLVREDGLWANISRYLLVLNGNRAVHVTFKTENDGLLGPIGLYFNPFTKTLIGEDMRY